MSKRFGRNQKRAMREKIKALEAAVYDAGADYEGRIYRLQRQIANAEGRAFERFMADKDRYEQVCARMADEVGRVVGENLKPYAEQLMREANRHRPMARFDASSDQMDVMVSRITVECPAVRYNMQVASY